MEIFSSTFHFLWMQYMHLVREDFGAHMTILVIFQSELSQAH